MDRMIGQADIIIAVISKGYIKSKNCGIEMKLAAEQGKLVIPINLELSHQEWTGGSLAAIGPPGDAVAMTTQFQSPCGDTKLYVDFTDIHKYATRLNHELLPRIAAAADTDTQPQAAAAGASTQPSASSAAGTAALHQQIAALQEQVRALKGQLQLTA